MNPCHPLMPNAAWRAFLAAHPGWHATRLAGPCARAAVLALPLLAGPATHAPGAVAPSVTNGWDALSGLPAGSSQPILAPYLSAPFGHPLTAWANPASRQMLGTSQEPQFGQRGDHGAVTSPPLPSYPVPEPPGVAVLMLAVAAAVVMRRGRG